ncbi:MAG TPA: HEAT repeat domain-containing protein [Aggregatilineaceae bacterium]|nr:HEAT repeat domain-containing protein [Aggregatilineaceae bacterium]
MGKPQWEPLLEQLQDPDPNARRKACQQMVAAADPAVIPFLRNVYLQDDDERVRQTAHDALAYFKALQQGGSASRPSAPSPLLSKLLPILAVTLVILVLANVVVRVLPSGGDDENTSDQSNPTEPTPRDTLTARMQDRIQQASEDAAALRGAIAEYYASGEVKCDADYHRPNPLHMAPIDSQTYSDLALIGINLDIVLDTTLRQVQLIWDHTCAIKTPVIQELLDATNKLDQIDYELSVQSTALQEAIVHPAPTFGPTITLTPTNTATATATFTAVPETTTPLPTGVLPSNTPEPGVTPTLTLLPSRTPLPTATQLPYPALDYGAVRRSLTERLVVIGDLQNRYGSGIIDRWQQAQAGQTLSTSACALQTWPAAFAFTAEQQAALDAPNVADPELESAVQLINEGLDLANQARAIYEPSCQNQSLGSTASSGIPLAQTALDRLNAAYDLLETIRKRDE